METKIKKEATFEPQSRLCGEFDVQTEKLLYIFKGE
jgi:hypothetical protein